MNYRIQISVTSSESFSARAEISLNRKYLELLNGFGSISLNSKYPELLNGFGSINSERFSGPGRRERKKERTGKGCWAAEEESGGIMKKRGRVGVLG